MQNRRASSRVQWCGMALHRRMRTWAIGWALLGAGCFTEPVDSTPSTTSDDMCDDGALGCECRDDGTCDAGLACDPAALRCVPEGCQPGEFACTCADGELCMDPLVCEVGICMSPGGGPPAGPTTGDDDASTSGISGATATTGLDPSMTGSDTGAEGGATDDGAMDTGSDGGPGDTGPVVDCNDDTCNGCHSCVDMQPSECEPEVSACELVAGGMTVANCLRDCGLTGFCFDPCCDGASAAAINAATDLAVCRSDGCSDACARYDLYGACN